MIYRFKMTIIVGMWVVIILSFGQSRLAKVVVFAPVMLLRHPHALDTLNHSQTKDQKLVLSAFGDSDVFSYLHGNRSLEFRNKIK